MAHQYLNDGEEEEATTRPANEPERHEGSHEDVSAEETSESVDEPVSSSTASNRQRRSKQEDAPKHSEPQAQAETEDVVVSSKDDDLRVLETQGFTKGEITRLVDLSVRLNEATLKRLQFTKWLVDQGLLDEFSLRSE